VWQVMVMGRPRASWSPSRRSWHPRCRPAAAESRERHGPRTSRSAGRALRFPVRSTPPRRGHKRRGPASHFGSEVLDPPRRRCGRRYQLRPDAARPPDRRHHYFREISAKHWHRPALVFNGGEEDTFEINLAQLNERTAGRAHPGDRRPLILRLATGRQSREALAASGRSGTMNNLADCAIARHGDAVASASITLQPALTAPGQVHTFTRQSLYRWGEDEQLIEPAVRASANRSRTPFAMVPSHHRPDADANGYGSR